MLLIGLIPAVISLCCIHFGDGASLIFLTTLATYLEQSSLASISTETIVLTSSSLPVLVTTGGLKGFLNVAAASLAIPITL